MASLKKKRFSIKRDPNQVIVISKPITASQTDGPASDHETSAGRMKNGNEERYFIVSCGLLLRANVSYIASGLYTNQQHFITLAIVMHCYTSCMHA